MALQSAGPISWSALNLAYGYNSNAQLGISQLRCTTSNVGVSNVSMSNFQNTLIPLESNVSYRQLSNSVTQFTNNANGNTIFSNNKGSFTYVTNTNVPNLEYFGIEWQGLMKLTVSGSHSFICNSDDGSEFFLNGTNVANYYGLHGSVDGPAGAITLNGGVYNFRLRMQEWTAGQSMTLKYQPPGTTGHNAISFPTYMCYNFVPYLKFDANDLFYRQGVQATNNIASWSNTGFELSGSANNSNATAFNNPTLQSDANGYMVRFDRTSSQYFSLGNLVFNRFRSDDSQNINGLTIFVVCRFSITSIGSYERIFDFGLGTNNDNILFSRFESTLNTNIDVYSSGTTKAISKYMVSTADGLFHVYALVATNGAPMTLAAYVDGLQLPATQLIDRVTPTNALNKTSLTSNYIGRSNWGDDYFTGDIREIQIFREVMPITLINRFNNYLMYKWGIASATQLPITSGLVGYYVGDTFTAGTQWTDLSGNGNHATTFNGTPVNTSVTLNGYKALSGGTGDGLRWTNSILPATYTLFHVAKYNGANEKRIFDGVPSNWLSGFWMGLSGVAYHNNWITQSSTDLHGTNWVISTDQNSLYRSNGVNRTTASPGTPSSVQISINFGNFTGERSDWAVACVIVYNRTLSTTECQQIECWLNRKYGVYQ